MQLGACGKHWMAEEGRTVGSVQGHMKLDYKDREEAPNPGSVISFDVE
jgi:hypothetical protein